VIRRLLFILLLLLPLPAAAQASPAQSLAGSWALRLEGSIIFRFDLVRDGDSWRGSWWRPRSFNTDGNRFGNIAEQAVKIDADKGKAIGEWAELSFPDNRPGAVPDIFRFHLIGPDKAEMIYAETGLAPYTLERVGPDTILGPWQQGKVYSRAGAQLPPGTRLPAPSRREVQGPPAVPGR